MVTYKLLKEVLYKSSLFGTVNKPFIKKKRDFLNLHLPDPKNVPNTIPDPFLKIFKFKEIVC